MLYSYKRSLKYFPIGKSRHSIIFQYFLILSDNGAVFSVYCPVIESKIVAVWHIQTVVRKETETSFIDSDFFFLAPHERNFDFDTCENFVFVYLTSHSVECKPIKV